MGTCAENEKKGEESPLVFPQPAGDVWPGPAQT